MVYGIENTTIAVAVLATIIGGGTVAMYYRRVALRVAEDVAELEEQAQENLDEEATGYGVNLDPPDVGRSILDVFKVWRHLSVQAKLAKRGYLKWYRVGARFHRPRWIKPEHKDSGQREYYSRKDGTTYIFPEEALVTDGRTSAYVAIHKVGEAEPIDLRDPGWPTLNGSALQRLAEMTIARDPPGRFGLGGLLSDPRMRYVGLAVVALGIWGFMQFGGVF